MADHSKPAAGDIYSNWPTLLDGRFDDLAKGLDPATTSPTNLPANAVGWSSALNKWRKWTGSAWADLSAAFALPIVGGSVNNSPVGATTPSTGKFTTLESTGNLDVGGNIYGTALLGKDASASVTIRPSTADGADNQFAVISGGGASASASRGAYAIFYGNEHANAGSLTISSGSAADLRLGVGGGTILTLMGTTGYLKHAYAGSAASPVYCLSNTENTGMFGGTNNVGLAANGVQAARFYDGYSAIGSNGASPNVFMYNYGTLSQSASATLQGLYQRVTFPVATGNGTTYVSQMHLGNTLDINDAGGALTIANVYGVNVNTPTINSSNAGTVISAFTQHRAADLPDTKIAIGRGYRSEVNEVSGKTRWQFEGAGTAPSYDGGDRHIAGNRFDKQPAPPVTITAATATISTASMLGRIIPVAGSSATVALTLPTGAVMDGAVDMPNSNFAFDWTVINTSGTYTASVAAAASGHAVVGNMTVAVNTSAMFRTRKTGANAFTTYRVG